MSTDGLSKWSVTDLLDLSKLFCKENLEKFNQCFCTQIDTLWPGQEQNDDDDDDDNVCF